AGRWSRNNDATGDEPGLAMGRNRGETMKRSNQDGWRRSLCAAVMLCTVSAGGAARADDFYIDESTDFTGNGCDAPGAAELNDVTSQLRDALVADSHSGHRFVNSLAWPQDFMEACSDSFGSDGSDDVFADTAPLAVYAGHGNKGLLAWGFMHNGRCTAVFGT